MNIGPMAPEDDPDVIKGGYSSADDEHDISF
jgi:hypothetical protein